jgi:hypothetical protein
MIAEASVLTSTTGIAIGEVDPTGNAIERVYVSNPDYSIYRTKNGTSVRFSNPEKEQTQRQHISQLAEIRFLINDLMEDWRTSKRTSVQAKARRYDGRVAAALTVCLEGDPSEARSELIQARDDLISDRISWARFDYLISTLVIVVLLVFIVSAIHFEIGSLERPINYLWLAINGGATGAFFSIALGIGNRTVLPDLYRWENRIDSVLRVIVAIISANIVVLIFGSLLTYIITKWNTNVGSGTDDWTLILLISFLAGFLERLVPDLLVGSSGTLQAHRIALRAASDATSTGTEVEWGLSSKFSRRKSQQLLQIGTQKLLQTQSQVFQTIADVNEKLSTLSLHPNLDNFEGFVTVRACDINGNTIAHEKPEFSENDLPALNGVILYPRQIVKLLVGIKRSENHDESAVSQRILITDGKAADTVTFDIRPDARGIQFTPARKFLTIQQDGKPTIVEFTFEAPTIPGSYDIFVAVLQKNRLIQVVPFPTHTFIGQ